MVPTSLSPRSLITYCLLFFPSFENNISYQRKVDGLTTHPPIIINNYASDTETNCFVVVNTIFVYYLHLIHKLTLEIVLN